MQQQPRAKSRTVDTTWLFAAAIAVFMAADAKAATIPSLGRDRMQSPIGAEGLLAKPGGERSPAEVEAAGAFESLIAGNLSAAEARFQRALRLDPGLTVALLGLADVRLRQGKPQQADVLTQKALAGEPLNASVHTAIGRLHFSQGRYVQARTSYERAIRLDARAFLAHLDLADLLMTAEKNPKAAIVKYRDALDIKPDYLPARLALGLALLESGDRPAALSEILQTAKAAPNDPSPWHLIGRIHAADRRFEDAAQALGKALQIEPGFAPALLDRADVYAEMGEDRKAVLDYEQAVKRNPRDSVSHVKLGMIHQRLGETKKATAAYRTALRLDPNLAVACNNLAMILLRAKGDLDEALALSNRAVAASPQVPQFHDTLGAVHRARGDQAAAIAALRKATTLPPQQAEIWFHLGQAYEESGLRSDALAAYRKSLEIDPAFGDAASARSRIAGLGI